MFHKLFLATEAQAVAQQAITLAVQAEVAQLDKEQTEGVGTALIPLVAVAVELALLAKMVKITSEARVAMVLPLQIGQLLHLQESTILTQAEVLGLA
jgi:hypothetical protein